MAGETETALQAAPEGETVASTTEVVTEQATGATETAAETATEAEKSVEKPKRTPWYTQRIDELTRQRREAERERDGYKRSLEQTLSAVKPAAETAEADAATGPLAPAQPETKLPPSEVEKRAAELIAVREFNAACDRTFDEGMKEFPTFKDSVDTLKALGALEQSFVESVIATDAPAKVLQHLGQNPEEAQRIMALPLRKQVIELDRIASTKPAAKPVSKTPPPVTPVGGAARTSQELRDDDKMEDWVAKRLKQREARAAR